jgi:hypothetical protein
LLIWAVLVPTFWFQRPSPSVKKIFALLFLKKRRKFFFDRPGFFGRLGPAAEARGDDIHFF